MQSDRPGPVRWRSRSSRPCDAPAWGPPAEHGPPHGQRTPEPLSGTPARWTPWGGGPRHTPSVVRVGVARGHRGHGRRAQPHPRSSRRGTAGGPEPQQESDGRRRGRSRGDTPIARRPSRSPDRTTPSTQPEAGQHVTAGPKVPSRNVATARSVTRGPGWSAAARDRARRRCDPPQSRHDARGATSQSWRAPRPHVGPRRAPR